MIRLLSLRTSVMRAPNASIMRRFSSLKASENTISRSYPFAAQMKASETPVVPAVYSTTVPRGTRRPLASAASIAARAIRSFMLPVGLAHSSFMRIVAEPGAATLLMSISGVLPMPARTPSGARVMSDFLRSLDVSQRHQRPPLRSTGWERLH